MKSFRLVKHQKQKAKIKHTPDKAILSTHVAVYKKQLQSSLKKGACVKKWAVCPKMKRGTKWGHQGANNRVLSLSEKGKSLAKRKAHED